MSKPSIRIMQLCHELGADKQRRFEKTYKRIPSLDEAGHIGVMSLANAIVMYLDEQSEGKP